MRTRCWHFCIGQYFFNFNLHTLICYVCYVLALETYLNSLAASVLTRTSVILGPADNPSKIKMCTPCRAIVAVQHEPHVSGSNAGRFREILTDFDRFCTHHHASSIMPCFSAGGWFNAVNFTQSSQIPWSHNFNHWMLSVNMTGARCIKMLPAIAADALDGGRMIPELQISRRVKFRNSSMQISVGLQDFLMLFAGH